MSSSVESQIEEYNSIKKKYQDFTLIMKDLITAFLEQEELEYIELQFRTKSTTSLEEKLKKPKYVNKTYKYITDLSGSRIIVFYPDDTPFIEDVIKENFIIDWKNSVNKREKLPSNAFGYGGIHYIVSLSKGIIEDYPEYKKYDKMKHEIQIHTLCQYTWASIQRKIEYKNEKLVSPILSRKLARLCALFELADDEFLRIKNERTSDLNKYDIVPMTIQAYALNSPICRDLFRKIRKKGTLKKTFDEDKRTIELLIDACKIAELNQIQQLNDLMSQDMFQEKILDIASQPDINLRAGYITLILLMVYLSSEKISSEYLIEKGLSNELSNLITTRNT